MPNNDLIEKPKLSVFQRIRKFFLIRGINEEKYSKAPEYLKSDPEVIESLMAKSYSNLSSLSEEHALEYLNQNPDIFKDLRKDLQEQYLTKHTDNTSGTLENI